MISPIKNEKDFLRRLRLTFTFKKYDARVPFFDISASLRLSCGTLASLVQFMFTQCARIAQRNRSAAQASVNQP